MRTLLSFGLACGFGFSIVVGCSGKAVETGTASAGSGGSEPMSAAGTTSVGAAGAAGTTPQGGSGGTKPQGGAGGTLHEPANHRPIATACDHTRAAGEGPAPPDAGYMYTGCTGDADCTDGANGRCKLSGNTSFRQCTYDDCFADADCVSAAGDGPKVCVCGGGLNTDNNVCLEGNCRIDAECGAGRFCSPSLGSCGHYMGYQGYYCHTPQDECSDDTDCGAGGSFGAAYCAFMPTVGHWQCSTSQCAG